MTVREALMKKYDATAPSTNAALQKQCALGHTASGAATSTFTGCPGNRRWVTYLLDAMLLQANGSPTFVDMKDATLAATRLRGGADTQVVSDAFAARGLGASSKAVDVEDTDPTAAYDSATAARNANVTFSILDAATGAPVKGSVYPGQYQARATPIATTLGGKEPDAQAPFVAGAYEFVVQAPGYGLQRFTATFAPGARSQVFRLTANVASAAKGAKASGAEGVRLANVIDDSESTDGGFSDVEGGTPVAGRAVTVDLAGGLNRITKIAVSALHRPADPELEGDFQGRLLGVRAFDLQASKDGGKTYATVYRSPADFFPADAPRAVAPDLNLRTVTLPTPVVADHLRMVVRSNTCTGQPVFQGVEKNATAEALAPTDCTTVAANATQVTITELQAFGTATTAAASGSGTGTGSGTGSGGGVAGPVVSGDRLPATGGSSLLAGLGALLVASAAFAVRRRHSA